MVTEMSLDGNSIRAFSHDEFVEPIDVAINEDKARLTPVEQSLGLYQRSVSKVKTFGSGMVSSYKEPLDKALVTGTELHNCPV